MVRAAAISISTLVLDPGCLMLQAAQPLMADILAEMAQDHFHKLASLSIKTRSAIELGKVAAAKFAPVTDDAYLQKLAAAQLGEDHLQKLAWALINNEVSWEELTELEKVAVGRVGGFGGAIKGIANFFTKGRNVSLPSPGGAPGGFVNRLKGAYNTVTKGPTPSLSPTPRTRGFRGSTGASTPGGSPGFTGRPGPYGAPGGGPPPAPTPRVPPQQAGAQMAQRFRELNPGGAALHGNEAVQQASRAAGGTAGPRKPLIGLKGKLMIGGTAATIGGGVLAHKALGTADNFLHSQPQGDYQYGMGSPSHFMNPQQM